MTARLAEALFIHPWPLNVRGLLNVLSIAVLASPPGAPLDLYPEVAAALEATAVVTGAPASKPKSVPSAEELRRILDLAQGQISAAARHLGCSRQQLYRWLDKRGLDRDAFRASDADR